MHSFDHGQQKIRRKHIVRIVWLMTSDLMEKMIQTLPLFRTHLLADLAGILAGGSDTRSDRRTSAGIERKNLRYLVSIAAPGETLWFAEGCENPLPAHVGARRRFVQHEIQVHIEQTRRVLGPLQIAAHPVKIVR